MQAEMGGRAARTRAALDAMDPAQRLTLEGYRPGAYLRMRFTGARAVPGALTHAALQGAGGCWSSVANLSLPNVACLSACLQGLLSVPGNDALGRMAATC